MELPGVASFIGFTGLQYVSFDASFVPAPPARVVEIGWRLAHEHWGKGYASEAAQASLDYAFGPLNLDEIAYKVYLIAPPRHQNGPATTEYLIAE